jgi:hypothetical protein
MRHVKIVDLRKKETPDGIVKEKVRNALLVSLRHRARFRVALRPQMADIWGVRQTLFLEDALLFASVLPGRRRTILDGVAASLGCPGVIRGIFRLHGRPLVPSLSLTSCSSVFTKADVGVNSLGARAGNSCECKKRAQPAPYGSRSIALSVF